jgi:DNA-binding transcriptional regulator YiaG
VTATRFRNVDVDPDAPVDSWPAEAIETLLSRGSLSDWRRLSAAIRANPWGPAARTVESVVGWGEHYGVDALMAEVIRHARAQLDAAARQRYAARIRRWRQKTGLSLRAFARLVGTSASRLSDYERGKVAPTTDVLGRIEHVAKANRHKGP